MITEGMPLIQLLAVGLTTTATAAPVGDSPLNVTLDDPQNEQIDVTLDFAAATDATVELTDGQVIYDTTTITGSAGGTQTVALRTGAADAGDYQIALDSPDATNVPELTPGTWINPDATDSNGNALYETSSLAYRPGSLHRAHRLLRRRLRRPGRRDPSHVGPDDRRRRAVIRRQRRVRRRYQQGRAGNGRAGRYHRAEIDIQR